MYLHESTPRLLVAACLVATCLAAGCTVTKLKSDNQGAASRIDTKEQELKLANEQRAAIEAEQRGLLNDLRTRELSLAEMETRLQELERRNAAAAVSTDEQRRVKAQREKALAEAKKRIQEVKRAPDQSTEAKERRLKQVREELRKTLELLAEI